MGKNHKKLINNLEKLRKSSGLTQQELSLVAEVSRKSINAIENGVYVPSTVLALKIARTLKCSVEDLFELPLNSEKNSTIEKTIKKTINVVMKYITPLIS